MQDAANPARSVSGGVQQRPCHFSTATHRYCRCALERRRSPRAKRNATAADRPGAGGALEPRRTLEVIGTRLRARTAPFGSLVAKIRERVCGAPAVSGAIVIITVFAGEHATGAIEAADICIVRAVARRAGEFLDAGPVAAEVAVGAWSVLADAAAAIVVTTRLPFAGRLAAVAVASSAYDSALAADSVALGMAIRAETLVVYTEILVVTGTRAAPQQPAAPIGPHATVAPSRTFGRWLAALAIVANIALRAVRDAGASVTGFAIVAVSIACAVVWVG